LSRRPLIKRATALLAAEIANAGVKGVAAGMKPHASYARRRSRGLARQIAINAGEDGSVVVGKIIENDTYAYGFDAQSGEFGNFCGQGRRRPDGAIAAPCQIDRVEKGGGVQRAGPPRSGATAKAAINALDIRE
jgi:hypothetical protein